MKVILITGISSGLGQAMAQRLAREPYRVYGTVRRPVFEMEGVQTLMAEMTSDQSVEQAIESIIQNEGRIDVLIHNAGMGIAGPAETTPMEDIRHQLEVNFLGAVRVVRAVLPHMRRQKAGMIVMISSIAGLVGLPYQSYYSASKFALEGFCQALYLETRPHHIRVVVIRPGDFQTSFTRNRKFCLSEPALEAYPASRKVKEIIDSDENEGLSPNLLANQIAKIIRKKNPSFSYSVASPLQKLVIPARRLLPEKMLLHLIGRHYQAI